MCFGHTRPPEGSGACHPIVTAGPYEAIIALALEEVCPLPAVEGPAPAVRQGLLDGDS
ncbi:hypothetical protein CBM2605_U10035 [Cupriavidus neocaledonicus]|uniref:Uncharacterized protein n=1 Tax=Cupriavidus neocaledonicus TaxID=1040979 RepID=A0ABY1VDN1_9BURK|nr:hypothetical protein CBM2605_U10035 [Cupriavidus neocaledonicus]